MEDRISNSSITSNRASLFAEVGFDAALSESLNVGHIPNFFEIGDEISHGNLGITFSGTEISSGGKVVIKEVKKTLLQPVDLNSLHKEISILTECQNYSGIIQLHCWFEEPTFFYIVTSKPEGGKLLDGLCQDGIQYGESIIRNTLRILLETVNYLQEKQISHRGLNPESIVLLSKTDLSQIALTNFAFSSKHDDKELGFQYYDNNPAFAAPEVLRSRQHDPNCDIWSIGVVAFLLLSGILPYDDRNPKKLLRKVRRGQKTEFPDAYWFDVSAMAMDFTSQCLTVDAANRPNAKQLLQHKWFFDDNNTILTDSLERLRFFNARRTRAENLRAEQLWESHLKNLGYSMAQVMSAVVIQTFARQWFSIRRTSRFRARSSAAFSLCSRPTFINNGNKSQDLEHLATTQENSTCSDTGPPQYIPLDNFRPTDCSSNQSFLRDETFNSVDSNDASFLKVISQDISSSSTSMTTTKSNDTTMARRRGGAVGSRVSGDVPPETGQLKKLQLNVSQNQTPQKLSFQERKDFRKRGGAVGSRVSGDAPPNLVHPSELSSERQLSFNPSERQTSCYIPDPSMSTTLEAQEEDEERSSNQNNKSSKTSKTNQHQKKSSSSKRPPPPPPSELLPTTHSRFPFGRCICSD